MIAGFLRRCQARTRTVRHQDVDPAEPVRHASSALWGNADPKRSFISLSALVPKVVGYDR
jgi:hypothetical protein